VITYKLIHVSSEYKIKLKKFTGLIKKKIIVNQKKYIQKLIQELIYYIIVNTYNSCIAINF